MHTILIRNYVYNVLRISLNRTTVTAYHLCVKFSLPKCIWGLSISVVVGIRPYYLAIWTLKFMCICLIGNCRRAVKISTRQIKMRSWLLKGMGAGTLIGLLHVTPKPHLLGYFRPTLFRYVPGARVIFRAGKLAKNAVEPPTKLLALGASHLRLRPLK